MQKGTVKHSRGRPYRVGEKQPPQGMLGHCHCRYSPDPPSETLHVSGKEELRHKANGETYGDDVMAAQAQALASDWYPGHHLALGAHGSRE